MATAHCSLNGTAGFNPLKDICYIFRQHGIPVQRISYSPEPGTTDDEIIINNAVSVQIGRNYYIVNGWEDAQTMRHWPKRHSPVGAIIKDIRAALTECPVTVDIVALTGCIQWEEAHVAARPDSFQYIPR